METITLELSLNIIFIGVAYGFLIGLIAWVLASLVEVFVDIANK